MSESLPTREENSFISPREVPEPQNSSFGVWMSRKVVSHFLKGLYILSPNDWTDLKPETENPWCILSCVPKTEKSRAMRTPGVPQLISGVKPNRNSCSPRRSPKGSRSSEWVEMFLAVYCECHLEHNSQWATSPFKEYSTNWSVV